MKTITNTGPTTAPLKITEVFVGVGLLAFAAFSIVTTAAILCGLAVADDRLKKWRLQ